MDDLSIFDGILEGSLVKHGIPKGYPTTAARQMRSEISCREGQARPDSSGRIKNLDQLAPDCPLKHLFTTLPARHFDRVF
jgi:hypothetical protein